MTKEKLANLSKAVNIIVRFVPADIEGFKPYLVSLNETGTTLRGLFYWR